MDAVNELKEKIASMWLYWNKVQSYTCKTLANIS